MIFFTFKKTTNNARSNTYKKYSKLHGNECRCRKRRESTLSRLSTTRVSGAWCRRLVFVARHSNSTVRRHSALVWLISVHLPVTEFKNSRLFLSLSLTRICSIHLLWFRFQFAGVRTVFVVVQGNFGVSDFIMFCFIFTFFVALLHSTSHRIA